MNSGLKDFLKEVFADYARRFWIFWVILYIATVMVEFWRQVLLESLDSVKYLYLSQTLFPQALLTELIQHPLRFLPFIGMLFFNVWGFGALYFSFASRSLGEAVSQGLKNLCRYFSYLVVAGIITIFGALVLTLPASIFLPNLLPNVLTNPLLLILALPGLYLLLTFSNAPLILLIENKSVLASLKTSWQRVSGHLRQAIFFLGSAALLAGVAYYALSWLIFTLKLVFIPNLSLLGESALRIFLYSLPWVVVASFYDLALYHFYLRLKSAPVESTQEAYQQKNASPAIPKYISQIIAAVLIIAVMASFALVPIPAQAGTIGTIFGTLALIMSCAIPPLVAACLGLGTFIIAGGIVAGGTVSGVTHATCSGNYDPVFGTCSSGESEGKQQIYTSSNVKIEKITYSSVPSPEEFTKNPTATGQVTIRWKGDAPGGVRNGLEVYDAATNKGFPQLSGTNLTTCNTGTFEAVYAIPFETKAKAKINYDTCVQVRGGKRSRSYALTCSGCGCTFGCGTLATTNFTTPSLPLPKVDIKADGKDSAVFKAGTPIKLSWTSEYALTCSAEGGWSGIKGTSGSENVTPSTGKEVYTIACARGDKVARDSVSSAPATKAINIFDVSAGGLGSLNISSFNITGPLKPGDTITISWSAQNAKSCEVDNRIGKIPTSGSVDVTFLKTTTFTLTCTDSDGKSVSAQKTVEVLKAPKSKEILPE